MRNKTYSEAEFQKMATAQYAAGVEAASKAVGFEVGALGFAEVLAGLKERGETLGGATPSGIVAADAGHSPLGVVRDACLDSSAAGGALAQVSQVSGSRDSSLENPFLEEMKGLKREVAALRAGVPAEKVGWYVRLAAAMDDGEDFDGALAGALREYPLAGIGDAMKAEADVAPPAVPRVVAKASGTGGAVRWRDMTLAARAKLYREDAEAARRMAAEAGERLV